MITYLSFNDWCGLAYHYCQAYKKFGSAKHIVYHDVARKYPREMCVALGGHKEIQEVINRAKLMHFVGDEPITIPWKWPQSSASFSVPNVPKALTVIGSYFRRSENKSISIPIYSENEIMANTDYRSVCTPDLLYPWFKAEYLPLAYDVNKTLVTWKKPEGKVRIGHSPTVRSKKGTDIIVEALEGDSRFELDIIENVTWNECIERKSKCHLFIEDLVSGIWGYSAIEAMAHGIPTISYLNTDFIANHPNLHDVPIVPCVPTVSGVKIAIENTLSKDLYDLSIKSRHFIEKIHSYETIGYKLYNLYPMLIR